MPFFFSYGNSTGLCTQQRHLVTVNHEPSPGDTTATTSLLDLQV